MDWPFRYGATAVGVAAVLAVLLPGAAAQPAPSDTTQVRVRIGQLSAVDAVDLTVREGPLAVHLPGGGPPVMRLQPGETTTLGLRQNDVYIRRGGNGLYATELRLRPAGAAATWRLTVEDQTRTYSGGLYLAPAPQSSSGLLAVNHVPIEDYVASVVASEYGLDDRAGARAMAVVARTYGLFASERFGGTYDQADGTVSQVYRGVDAVTDASRAATRTTEGEVLTHDRTLIQAVYFSSSGGHTANNEDVWAAKTPIPYLRGREDPYDDASPHHTWSATVDRSALLRVLTRRRGTSVEGFTIADRADHGRVTTLNVLQSDGSTHEMNANAFRLAVNRGVAGSPLKSTWFDARRSGDQYVFDGRGFGHGVGLSQWGAHAMAEQGESYRDILRYYYTDVAVRPLDEVQTDPQAAPVARRPDAPATDERRIGW
jgi:stage II sporulation protein D